MLPGSDRPDEDVARRQTVTDGRLGARRGHEGVDEAVTVLLVLATVTPTDSLPSPATR